MGTAAAVVLFSVGTLPLLFIAFLSSGLGSNGAWDLLLSAYSVLTLVCLIWAARKRKPLWALVGLQVLLMALVLYETFSDASLYMGT